jgi:hypothetical protein
MWHYWIEGCLANSNTRFRKFFRLCRARFDEIYEAAALSGQFVLNPAEPPYAKACPPLPPGSDGRHVAQHTKVPPLCMRIAAFMRRLATGESFDSLEASFNISRPVLQKFFLEFAAWFDKEYYVPYIGGISGVGFDTRTEIVESERLFRAMGLPGTLTCMDAVHMAYENAPYPSRHLFIGKEGYPTVGVYMHSNAIGWIKYVGAIFPVGISGVGGSCSEPLFRTRFFLHLFSHKAATLAACRCLCGALRACPSAERLRLSTTGMRPPRPWRAW